MSLALRMGRTLSELRQSMTASEMLMWIEYDRISPVGDIRFIRKHFSVVLERTVSELRGEPCLGLEEFAPAKQEIVCSRSFGGRVSDYIEMRQAICSYASRAAEKLRGEH